ncbi:MAG: rRNA ((1402)-N(4))-methyltransferase [Bacteroidota bacterium]
MNPYHVSVMFQECIDGLNIRPDGTYVDVTFGGGGHSKGILEKLGPEGKLFAFDQDADAANNAKEINDPRFKLIQTNFRHLSKYLRLYGVKKVDGILADFGVSSHQIDEPSRGFSFRFDGPLDMRMNKDAEKSASEILNEYPGEQLHKIFGIYGEIKNAKTLAHAIVQQRSIKPFSTTQDFKEVLNSLAPKFKEFKYFAQAFQAIRIEVNEELKVIEELLIQAPEILTNEGRLCILTFHSLEDRLVKNFFKSGDFQGHEKKDLYGNNLRPLNPVNRKPILAGEEELKVNSRSRSAKLRIAQLNN